MNYRIISITLLMADQTCFAQNQFDPKAAEEKFNQIEQACNRQADITQKTFELSLEIHDTSLCMLKCQAKSNIILGLSGAAATGVYWYNNPSLISTICLAGCNLYTLFNFGVLVGLEERIKQIESSLLSYFKKPKCP